MAASDFEITYDDGGITIALENMAERAQGLRKAHAAAGELAIAMIDERYATEMGPGGVPLPKNTDFTLREKRRLGRINKVLQSTGIMKARTFYQVRDDGFIFGTSDKKARKHFRGIGVPVRDVWTPDPENIEEFALTYQDFILAGVV